MRKNREIALIELEAEIRQLASDNIKEYKIGKKFNFMCKNCLDVKMEKDLLYKEALINLKELLE